MPRNCSSSLKTSGGWVFPERNFHWAQSTEFPVWISCRNGPTWSQSWNIPQRKRMIFMMHTQPETSQVVSIIECPLAKASGISGMFHLCVDSFSSALVEERVQSPSIPWGEFIHCPEGGKTLPSICLRFSDYFELSRQGPRRRSG